MILIDNSQISPIIAQLKETIELGLFGDGTTRVLGFFSHELQSRKIYWTFQTNTLYRNILYRNSREFDAILGGNFLMTTVKNN